MLELLAILTTDPPELHHKLQVVDLDGVYIFEKPIESTYICFTLTCLNI